MKKTRKVLILLSLCMAFLVLPLGMLIPVMQPQSTSYVQAESVEFDYASELPTQVSRGETVTLPTAEFEIGGQKLIANTSTVSPSGSVYSSSKLTLDEFGEYKIEYYLIKNGVKYSQIQSITVVQSLFSMEGALSSWSFGTEERQIYKGATGAKVAISAGDTLTYYKVVDITDNVYNESLFTFTPTPVTEGVADGSNTMITFTDLYDPTTSVAIMIPQTTGFSYVRAYLNGDMENYVGCQSNSSGTLIEEITGTKYKIHRNSWGCETTLNNAGATSLEGKDSFQISYDSERQSFWIASQRSEYNYEDAEGNPVKIKAEERRRMITDLDNLEIYDKPFQGFKSGKVIITMSVGSISSGAYNCVIKNIDGEDITDALVATETEPQMEVDLNGLDYVPHGVKGASYPIFNIDARAAVNNSISLDTSVYYGYHTGSPVEVEIEDGFFKTQYDGVYTIVYTATDLFGKQFVEYVDVQVGTYPDMAISFDTESVNEYIVAQACYAPVPTVSSSYDDSFIKVTAKAVLKSNPNVVYEVVDGKFTPYVPGEYKIQFTCSDYAQTQVFDFDCTVKYTDKPVLEGAPNLPKYLIKGAKYTLPTFSGMAYTADGGKSVNAQIECIEDGVNSVTVPANNEYTVGASNSVTVRYVVKNGSAESVYSKDIRVVDVNYGIDTTTNTMNLDLTKYFYPTAGDVSVTSQSGVDYLTVTAGAEGGKVDFIRELIAHEMNLTLGYLSAERELSIYLTDMYNENESVKLTYRKNVSGFYMFYVNDVVVKKMIKDITGEFLVPTYNAQSQEIEYETAQFKKIETYLNGETFQGFSSGFVYVSIELSAGAGDVSFRISKINGQQFNSTKYDVVRPYYQNHDVFAAQNINSVVTIKATLFSDVLDPNISVSVSVVKPDGRTPVTSIDGVKLSNLTSLDRDYQIKLEEYGIYSVRYSISDTAFNMVKNRGYAITVEDGVPPVITLKDVPQAAKVGTNVPLAKIYFEDNIDDEKDMTVFVTIKSPDSTFEHISYRGEYDPPFEPAGENYYLCDKVGYYVVYVCVYDSAGNTSFAEYKIKIS